MADASGARPLRCQGGLGTTSGCHRAVKGDLLDSAGFGTSVGTTRNDGMSTSDGGTGIGGGSGIDGAPPTGEERGRSRQGTTLVTGANGEFGHGLIRALHESGHRDIVALDVQECDPALRPFCREVITADIVDEKRMDRFVASYEITTIYHLAALLSTKAEFHPEAAHQVNVDGTLNLLHLAASQSASHGEVVRFLFPSSIAVYGIPDLAAKRAAGAVGEGDFLEPTTMYGCNKLACEQLGRYYMRHYKQLARERPSHGGVDFRSIRFPGVISAFTVPTGGTSDFAPEMLHAAASGQAYACFVREDTTIPFITMPDAVQALRRLADADRASLTRCVYNIDGFSPSAGDVASRVREAFPGAEIRTAVDEPRQAIVDSWPESVDDAAARADWGWKPQHGLDSAFDDYLVPNIREKYERV